MAMDITVREDVYQQLQDVKEWMESRREREVTLDEVLREILQQFQLVLYPEDLGSA
jgi:predicted CopG family antitoxin